MTPTEKEIDVFAVYGKESNGCKRHEKDMMLSYTFKGEKELVRVLPSKKEILDKFKNLGIDKKVLAEIIEASQTYQQKEQEYAPKDIIDLFMTNKQGDFFLLKK